MHLRPSTVRRLVSADGRSERARSAVFAIAAKFSEHVSVTMDGVTYVLSTADHGVGKGIFVRRRRPELVVLPRALQAIGEREWRGTCFVDVGASIGTTTLPALLVHGLGDAVACEPSPGSAALLRANAALNGLGGRVTIVEAAVSDVEGDVQMELSAANPGRNKIAAAGAVEATTVPAVTLDGLVERRVIDPARVGMVWIDAQGHELQILSEASLLLERRPPLVVAVRARKFARAPGSLERLTELLAERYERVVDLRAPTAAPMIDWQPVFRGVAEIPEIVATGANTKDLLLV